MRPRCGCASYNRDVSGPDESISRLAFFTFYEACVFLHTCDDTCRTPTYVYAPPPVLNGERDLDLRRGEEGETRGNGGGRTYSVSKKLGRTEERLFRSCPVRVSFHQSFLRAFAGYVELLARAVLRSVSLFDESYVTLPICKFIDVRDARSSQVV